jgi:N-acetylmuramoyl-L-alanine amidase
VIRALLLIAALGDPAARAPETVTITTTRGEARIPVIRDAVGGPLLAAPLLAQALRAEVSGDSGWYQFTIARQPFGFVPGIAAYRYNDRLEALAGTPMVRHDTLFVPLQFAAEILPAHFGERYQYDPVSARLTEVGAQPRPAVAVSDRLPNGLRRGHVVTVDPGHGGIDPGTHGRYFPRGVTESVVTLQISLLLRDELKSRGIGVIMTRTTDTLIALGDRGRYCADACDLFLSIHVNSLPPRAADPNRRGFATYFLAEAKTEEASRVEQMENDAIRFEAPASRDSARGGLDYILRDLQLNEYLRESARLAELIQAMLGPVHPGGDRGVKQAGFMVLTTAQRPAVLVETGYRTNVQDARLLSNRNSQRALAAAIADAVVAYLLEYERRADASADSMKRSRS